MTKTKILVIIGAVLALSFIGVRYLDKSENLPKEDRTEKPVPVNITQTQEEPKTKDFDEAWLNFKRAFRPAWTAEIDGNYKYPTIVATNVTNGLKVEFRLDEVAPLHIDGVDGEVQFSVLCKKLDKCIIVTMNENMDRIERATFEKTSAQQMERTFNDLIDEWQKLNSKKASR